MVRRSILLLVALALAACGGDAAAETTTAATTTLTAPTTSTTVLATTTTSTTLPPALTEADTVTTAGLGPVKIGMTVEEATLAAGRMMEGPPGAGLLLRLAGRSRRGRVHDHQRQDRPGRHHRRADHYPKRSEDRHDRA